MQNSQRIILLLISFFIYDRFLFQPIDAIGNLRIAYQWKEIDYDWPNDDVKKLFPDYNREDNLPLGLDIADNRIFVTVPRWRRGVAASLNYINLNDTRESPPFTPYPSWEAHEYGSGNGTPELVSPFRLKVDRCSRLWVLDTGLVDIMGNPEQRVPPALVIYDLKDDTPLRKFIIPPDQRTADSFFANIAVEDYNCEDTYAYLGDLGAPGLVVYSWKLDRSWLVKHHFFHPDPKGGNFNVSGLAFVWTDGIFGMSLAPTQDGYNTLYFHPLSSTMEFSVSTKLLRDPERINSPESFHEFQPLGSRGSNGQSSVSFIDPNTGVMFYALTNFNAIACWRPSNKFSLQQQSFVYVDNVTMIFPNDLKVDHKSNIWILSDRLPIFMYSRLDPDDYNYRILVGSTEDLIRDTVCSKDFDISLKNPNNPGTTFIDTNDLIPEMKKEREHHSGAGEIKRKMSSKQKIKSSIPGLAYPLARNKIMKTPYGFLKARAQQDGAEGLWRIRNGLYDLRTFAKSHPGGAEWITLTKGTDITEAFEAHHITEKAERILPKFYIRDATTPRSIPLTFEPNGFYRTFKKRALEALKDVDFHRPSKISNLIADSFFATTVFFSLLAVYSHILSFIAIIIAGIFLAWTTIIGHNYFHMRNNFRMYYFDLSLMSSKEWRITHAMSHHLYPNTLWDYEIYAIEPFLEWLPDKNKNIFMSFISQISSPIIYALTFIQQGIKRYYSVIWEYGTVEVRDIVPFILPIVMSFVAPSVFVAFKTWIIIILISSFIFSFIGFNAAHHHPNIFHDGDIYRENLDWGLLELDAVRDREIIDDVPLLVLINFGSHGLHHLLPSVDHSYLPLAMPAFLQTCKEFGVSTEKWTQWELLKGQFKQLARVEYKKNHR